jgi:phosphoglucosamine mutase
MARRYFGTDGVRGIVGADLTADLVERLGRAAALWSGSGRVFVGRDTRGSGPELEQAFAEGVSSAGGNAVLGGVLPTPAVALLALDLGAVISASHNPPEYNGVKFFDGDGQKLTDTSEEEIEALLDEPAQAERGEIEHVGDSAQKYLEHVLAGFGSDLSGLRIAVDCANGAYSDIAPEAFRRLGADVIPLGNKPDGSNINVGCGATNLSQLSRVAREQRVALGVAFDGDGDRLLAVDAAGNAIGGDQILALLALHLDVDVVVVTVMTNLGFHRLMEKNGIRVVTTDVGDRYVLEALRREGAILGGEQSGHIICLDGHVTGDGLAAALLLCRALDGSSLADATAVMPRFAQVMENVPARTQDLSVALLQEIDRINAELDGSARIVVRPSGTEPVIRVLAEAEGPREAASLCVKIAALVRRELG